LEITWRFLGKKWHFSKFLAFSAWIGAKLHTQKGICDIVFLQIFAQACAEIKILR